MDIASLTATQLKQAADIAAKKEVLQSQIADLDRRLANIIGEAPTTTTFKKIAGAKARGPQTKPASKAKGGTKGKAKRGTLKDQIVGRLQSAGTSGISIKDLAGHLKTKPANLYAWFNSTGKKVAGLQKIGRGIYALAE